ncbi:C39 family peptidase [Helcococcus kunzii]|uniref:C39 family peptidase n=1 Tax=Helcococcus kunzii TaxID=40091 RepID=UPI00389BEBE1
MMSNKSFKNLIMTLSVIFLAIVLFMNFEKITDMFGKNSEFKYQDSPAINDYKDGKILGKYSEQEFKKMLITAKNSFSYDNNRDKLQQLEELKVYIPEVQDIIDKYDGIPQSVIKTVLMYPENFLWVHGFTNSDMTENVISKYEKKLDIPYFLQTDTRWGYKRVGNYRFGVVGCGPTSMSMIYMALTKDYSMTPNKMIDFSLENGYYEESIGTLWKFMTEGAEKLGLKSKEVPLDKNRMKEELSDSKLIIASVGPGDFTRSGHILVIVGYNNGEFKIYDPNSWVNTEKTWSYERIAPQIKNMWSISK